MLLAFLRKVNGRRVTGLRLQYEDRGPGFLIARAGKTDYAPAQGVNLMAFVPCWRLLVLILVGTALVGTALGASAAAPAAMTRTDFARALARVQPGMKADQVRQLLGEPGDIRTERDPGGIAAARTVAVWRYGTAGHLTFGTLGTVHLQADGTVQYVFGGRGTPPSEELFEERELRRLLCLLDKVPSYNAPGDPLAIIQAVNALYRLGKERALAVVSEYLRVSSWLDDSGREGTFLVVRALFEVPDPPGYQPAMLVGAPAPPGLMDPKAVPRFPLAVIEDIPLKLVSGYSLGGVPEPPEAHLSWFRQHGVLRARPLVPPELPLAVLDRLAGTTGTPFLTATGLANEGGQRLLLEQGLKLVRTALLASLPSDIPIAAAWQKVKAALGGRRVVWDAQANLYSLADGSVARQWPGPQYQRAIWKPALPGGVLQVILERSSPTAVKAELRVELSSGATLPKGTLRFRTADGRELLALAIQALHASPSSGSGVVQGGVFPLREGHPISAELALAGLSELHEQLTP